MNNSDKIRRITVPTKPLVIIEEPDGLGSRYDGNMSIAVEVALATKHGMNVTLHTDAIAAPDNDVFFYIRLEHPWRKPDGREDYDEFVTDGEVFYLGFRPFGKTRLIFTSSLVSKLTKIIENYVKELTK